MAGIYFPRGASQNTPTPKNLQKLPDDYHLPFDLDPFSTPGGGLVKLTGHVGRRQALNYLLGMDWTGRMISFCITHLQCKTLGGFEGANHPMLSLENLENIGSSIAARFSLPS